MHVPTARPPCVDGVTKPHPKVLANWPKDVASAFYFNTLTKSNKCAMVDGMDWDTELEGTLREARLYRVKKYKSTDDTLKLVLVWDVQYSNGDEPEDSRRSSIWDFVPLQDMRLDMASGGKRLITMDEIPHGSRLFKRLQAIIGSDAAILYHPHHCYIDVVPSILRPEGLLHDGVFDISLVPSFLEVRSGTAPLIIGNWGAARILEDGETPVPEEDQTVSASEITEYSSPVIIQARTQERDTGGHNFEIVHIIGAGPLELDNTNFGTDDTVSAQKPEALVAVSESEDGFPKDLPF